MKLDLNLRLGSMTLALLLGACSSETGASSAQALTAEQAPPAAERAAPAAEAPARAAPVETVGVAASAPQVERPVVQAQPVVAPQAQRGASAPQTNGQVGNPGNAARVPDRVIQCDPTGQTPHSSDGPPYTCSTCVIGGSCDPGNPCRLGVITACTSTTIICTDNGPRPAGTTCGPAGSGMACDGVMSCGCPPGTATCGGTTCVAVGGTCTAGVGACARTGNTVCAAAMNGTTVCNAVPGSPGAETCNGMDDNCNGLIDDGIAATPCTPGVCQLGQNICMPGGVTACVLSSYTAAGTACSPPGSGVCNGTGACVCPTGSSLCLGVCTPTGATCTVGVGACARTGTMQCPGGGAITCSAVPGTPTAEVCDGIDNDCDGIVDDLNITQGTGLRMEIYNDRYLTPGLLRTVQIDSAINDNWGGGGPVPGGNVDNFSVRWSGFIIAPTTGLYTFYPGSDDGIRLYINGSLVVNSWYDRGYTVDTSPTVSLTAAQRTPITVEFYENGGGAMATLEWSGPGIARQIVPTANLAPGGGGFRGEYYNGTLTPGSVGVAMVRQDDTINFDWGTGSPDGAWVGVDNFSVRWTGVIVPRYTQNYVFRTTSDDGVRLWINGILVIDNWTAHAPTDNYSPAVALTAGVAASVRMEYFDSGFGAVARLYWSSPSQAEEIVPPQASRPDPTPTCQPAQCQVGYPYCAAGVQQCAYAFPSPAGSPCATGVCNGAGLCGCPPGQSLCGGVCLPTGAFCINGTGSCARGGSTVCNPNGTATTVCNAIPGAPTAEVCNNLDDDCDGIIDDGIPSLGACSTGNPCTAGQQVCSGGSWVCSGISNANEGGACAPPAGTASYNATVAGPWAGSGSNGGSGARCLGNYSFTATAGQTYTISTCGTFSGDTYLVVSGACSCSNDDSCGYGSSCTCTATSSGTVNVCASTFSTASASWNYVVTSTVGGPSTCRSGVCTCPPGTTNQGGVCVGTGALRFTLTWSQPADEDLEVRLPTGAEISYLNRNASGGTLDYDSIGGYGPENVFWTTGAPRGTYIVCANPYNVNSYCSGCSPAFVLDIHSDTMGSDLYYYGNRPGNYGYRACTTGLANGWVTNYTY